MSAARLRIAVVVASLVLAAGAARAGRSCEERPPSADGVARSMALAERTAEHLERSGAQVVVLARAGQNLSEYRVRWSHLGFAYRDGDGRWRVVHKLNQCGSARGTLWRQGLGEFFLDDPWRYEAAWVVPRPDVQARLLPALRDNARIAQLDEPAYSVVAYPWAVTYQQSNQWAIETLAMTEEPAAATRARAQAWLRLHAYRPAVLHIGALKRLGARLTAANVAFDDHPDAQRFADRIETVTVDSVFAWLGASGLGGAVQVIR